MSSFLPASFARMAAAIRAGDDAAAEAEFTLLMDTRHAKASAELQAIVGRALSDAPKRDRLGAASSRFNPALRRS